MKIFEANEQEGFELTVRPRVLYERNGEPRSPLAIILEVSVGPRGARHSEDFHDCSDETVDDFYKEVESGDRIKLVVQP